MIWRFLVCCVAICAVPSGAKAQRAVDIQLWMPPAGPPATFGIERGGAGQHLGLSMGLATSYAREPLVRRVACSVPGQTTLDSSCVDGDGTTPLVSDLWQTDLLLSLGLYRHLELGLAVPVVVARLADDLGLPQALRTRAGPGDARLSFKATLLRGRGALAAQLLATLPSGDSTELMGSPAWTVTPSLIGDLRLGGTRLAARVGYRVRRRVGTPIFEQDDELEVIAGVAQALVRDVDVILEVQGRVGLGGRTSASEEAPLEARLGARLALSPATQLGVGLGAGLPPGEDGYGAPLLRVLAELRHNLSLRETSRPAPTRYADADADGVADTRDRCPTRSEDADGFQDGDGCPEPDNDGDGVIDGWDRCAMDPEDPDGFEDGDGCPESGPKRTTVTFTDTRILVSERIYFDHGKDSLRKVSMPVLDQVAEAIGLLPQGTRVRVDGHTDDPSSSPGNTDLSFRRARSVMLYLRGRGVPEDRLNYRGHGGSRPIAPNTSPEGRALNRRVEFTILR